MEALQSVPRDKDTLDHFQLLLSLEGERGGCACLGDGQCFQLTQGKIGICYSVDHTGGVKLVPTQPCSIPGTRWMKVFPFSFD